MHGRNSVNVILDRRAHSSRRSGARDIHLTAFLRDRLSVELSLRVLFTIETRQSLLPSHARPTVDWTAIRYDINNTWSQERRTFILPVSGTSVRLTRRRAIYLICFFIRKREFKTDVQLRSALTEIRPENIKTNDVEARRRWLDKISLTVQRANSVLTEEFPKSRGFFPIFATVSSVRDFQRINNDISVYLRRERRKVQSSGSRSIKLPQYRWWRWGNFHDSQIDRNRKSCLAPLPIRTPAACV